MVSSEVIETFYSGNNSTSTGYSVAFDYLDDPANVKASVIAQGTGTVTIADGVATFSSAQTTLVTGSRVRVSGTNYTVLSATSSTVYRLTTNPTVSSSNFHILDDSTALVRGSTFTLTEVGVGAPYITTATAYANTYLVRVYLDVPLTQPLELSSSGPVLGDEVERALDRVTRQVQQTNNLVTNLAVVHAVAGATSSQDTTTFANTAARTAATPVRLGQLGVQLDTNDQYYGSSLVAGGWTKTTQGVSKILTSATSTSDYVGQIGILTPSGTDPTKGYVYSPWRSTNTSSHTWTPVVPAHTYQASQYVPWRAGEILVAGDRRWCGISGVIRSIDRITMAVDKPGDSDLKVRAYAISTAGATTLLTTGTVTISASYIQKTIQGGDSPEINLDLLYGEGYLNFDDRIEVEIVSTGDEISLDTTGGSHVSSPDSGDLASLSTGVSVTSDDGNTWVGTVNGDGTVTLVHPSSSTATQVITAGGRALVRLMEVSLAGGVTNITGVVAADTTYIRPGDLVIGATVPDGTVVETVSTTSFTINNPLNGATTKIATLSVSRPPVIQFAGISALSGATSVTLPVTTNINVGDAVTGTNVASGTYVTAKTSSTITISAGLSGDITAATIAPPARVATVSAGSTSVTLNHTTGLLVGSKVTGAGLPANTYITAVASPVITISNAAVMAMSGAGTDIVTVTRDVLQVTASVTADSTTMTLPYAVSTTPIVAGYEVTGDEFQPGTFVSSVGGSNVTLSKAAKATNASATVQLNQTAQWKGLSLTIAGMVYSGSTDL